MTPPPLYLKGQFMNKSAVAKKNKSLTHSMIGVPGPKSAAIVTKLSGRLPRVTAENGHYPAISIRYNGTDGPPSIHEKAAREFCKQIPYGGRLYGSPLATSRGNVNAMVWILADAPSSIESPK